MLGCWFDNVVLGALDQYAEERRFGRAGLVLFLGLGSALRLSPWERWWRASAR
ncbi:hypothetical protein [Myxococcus sp. RHSTA-1-4]|uniref:hypothetical protein n=1 Tax=Myxococcus sp. RHSTA-1-4 TaxID=2874601 RepID=UPI001CBB10A7|nr:hypothetical protein [Myxococcus sp. RHSTA-1-4]